MYEIAKGKIINFRGRVISSSEISILPVKIIDRLVKKSIIKIIKSHGKENDTRGASDAGTLPSSRTPKKGRRKRDDSQG